MISKHGDKMTGAKIVDLLSRYWHQTKLIAFRIALIGIFISALIPGARAFIFGVPSIALPLIVALGFLAFEILFSATKSSRDLRATGLVLEHPQEMVSQLEPAFSSQRVILDICAYSSETFHGILAPFFKRILNRQLNIKQLHICLLVRDYRRPFIVPCDGNIKEDEAYREATVSRNKKFIDDFKADINQIKDNCPHIDIEFEVRLHPFEPLFKGVVINGSRAFWNIYSIMNARRLIRGEEKIIWDYYGERTHLIQLEPNGPIAEREIFSSFVNWFTTVWDYFAAPLEEVHYGELQRKL
ncbi:MAG: hypothetical protein FD156_2463 [Nitrospirae bacterium]|nr:MAG: hypothetical protein FD156_2463 [Nitrospirota bacterium]